MKHLLPILFSLCLLLAFTSFAEEKLKLPDDPAEACSQAKALLEKCEGSEEENIEKSKDFQQALTLLRHAVSLGDPDAMFTLAYLTQEGIGVKKDTPAAVKLLESAAQKGHGGSMMNLGSYWSDPAHKDDAKAAGYFRTAMERGIPGAGLRFGALCYAGRGVERDVVRAAAAFSSDAIKGDSMAQNLYGVMLFTGEGTGKNPAEAVEWFSKSAKQGFAPALNNLGVLARLSNSKEGVEEAFRLFTRSAEKGYAPARRNLAQMYIDGAGTAVDYKKARELAEAAAAQGDASAYQMLGMMEMLAIGTERNPEKAAGYYLKSAEKGYAPACLQLSEMYRNGIGVAKDEKAADLWLKKASEPKKRPMEALTAGDSQKK